MNIARILEEIEKLEKSGFTRDQAVAQVSTMDDVIDDRTSSAINRLKLEMTIRFGSIMAGGLILFTAVISVLILKH